MSTLHPNPHLTQSATVDAKEPLVSVIMGAFNCAETLRPAIESILEQTYSDFELIVCDDGSNDMTLQVARRCQALDSRIVVIENATNIGLGPTLNHCLSVARGEFIARMDGDDLCSPSRFQRQLNLLKSTPSVSWVGTAAHYFDDSGIWGRGEVASVPTQMMLARGAPFIHASVIIHRSAIAAVGNYSETRSRQRVEDFDLWVRLYAAGYKGMNINEPLYAIRNDRNAAVRRSFRPRLNESRVIATAVRALRLAPWQYLRALRPLALGLIPVELYHTLFRWYHRSEPHSPTRPVTGAQTNSWGNLMKSMPGSSQLVA